MIRGLLDIAVFLFACWFLWYVVDPWLDRHKARREWADIEQRLRMVKALDSDPR
jgi:peptidoglycan/LPS O-acetylase OafA/YrhL